MEQEADIAAVEGVHVLVEGERNRREFTREEKESAFNDTKASRAP